MTIRAQIRQVARNHGNDLEWLCIALKVGWAAWLLCPFWDVFPGHPSYDSLAFAPEWMWGLSMLCMAVLHSYSILWDKRELRRDILVAALIFWMGLALGMLHADYTSTGIPTYGIIGLVGEGLARARQRYP